MNSVDIIALVLVVYFLYSGWRKGLFHSLLGPISLLICINLSYLYYKKTNSILISLTIAIAGPLLIKIMFSLGHAILQKADNRKAEITLLSRFFGSCVNFIWAAGLMLLTVFLLLMVPPKMLGITKVREHIVNSKTFDLILKTCKDKIPLLSQIKEPVQVLADNSKLSGIEDTEVYKKLLKDERVRDLFSDEETLQQIKEKDITKLINNPKVFAIIQDRELLQQFFEMHKKIIEENARNPIPGAEEESGTDF